MATASDVVTVSITLPQIAGIVVTLAGFFWGLITLIVNQYKKSVEREINALHENITALDRKYIDKLEHIKSLNASVAEQVALVDNRVRDMSESLAVAKDRLSRRND